MQTTTTDMFKAFMQDEDATDMFITGRAGTGKTTSMAAIAALCDDLGLEYYICAYTHKACNVLRSVIPDGNICTLHKFLKKRPTVNTDAVHKNHVEISRQHGEALEAQLLIVDEYSMVGERDLMDIRGIEGLKVLWLGDPYQLPPVGDMQSVNAYGKYQITLTKVYRQASGNPLMAPLNQLVSFIEGSAPITKLIENSSFVRNQDIVASYMTREHQDSVLLAFTNKRVQQLNSFIQGREYPIYKDEVFCTANRQTYTYLINQSPRAVTAVTCLSTGEMLVPGTKYKTLEHLCRMPYISFATVMDDDAEECTLATVFGYHNYNVAKKLLSKAAVDSNIAIEKAYPGIRPAAWARQNPDHKLAKIRSAAWRDYLTFDQCVVCLDFTHAMTVHKSQGSTYKAVCLDTQDLAIAAEIDYTQYLKLMYVAISRATDYVITN